MILSSLASNSQNQLLSFVIKQINQFRQQNMKINEQLEAHFFHCRIQILIKFEFIIIEVLFNRINL